MATKSTLTTLRFLADSAENESARVVAQRRNALDAEEVRLEQLKKYLQEYQADDNGSGIFIDTVRTRRAFVERISSGIDQQARLIEGLRQQLEMDLQRWREARSQALGLQHYSERQQQEIDLKQNRKEQARLDEIGQTMHQRAAG